MQNGFFESNLDPSRIRDRLLELENGKVGFYSVGLYPISLAYNCAMQTADPQLLLAPRPGRALLGAFSAAEIAGMDPEHLASLEAMGSHLPDVADVIAGAACTPPPDSPNTQAARCTLTPT